MGARLEMAQKIGIVIPTYNRSDEVRRCLTTVRQSIAAYECPIETTIVVVNDGYRGGFKEEFEQADIYCWHYNDGYRLATARNFGARIVVGSGVDTLIFLDDDLVPNDEWFGKMVDAINNTPSAIAFGSINGNHITLRASDKRTWLKATGGNMAVSVDTWKKVGEFDERYNNNWGVEDTDWCYRAIELHNIEMIQADADVIHGVHVPRKNWLEEQKANWIKFATKFPRVGARPVPKRTDGCVKFDSNYDMFSEMFLITATKDRPVAVKGWTTERLLWGMSFVVANDSLSNKSLALQMPSSESTNVCLISLSTHGAGTSGATRVAVEKAMQVGAKYAIELDDHDTLKNGIADISQIYKALKGGADYVYANYTLMHHDGRSKPVITSDYEPGILMAKGMQWLGFKAYSLDAYKDVGGYIDDEFPAGDYSLALRFEMAGKNIQKAGDVWTICTVEGEGDEGSLMMTQRSEARRKVIEYKEKYKNLIQNT